MRKIAAAARLLSKFRCRPASYILPKPQMASAFTSFQEVEDWDRPFTDAELQAIDAAFHYADETTSTNTAMLTSSSSPTKKHHLSTSVSADTLSKTRRRLPDSLFLFQRQNASSLSLSPCHRNRCHSYNSYCTKVSSPYPGYRKMKHPELAFKGQTVYSRTLIEVEKSVEELLHFVQVKKEKEGKAILGFDIEWRPTFIRGRSPGKAAVMQICGDNNRCYVLHIFHTGIPQNLQNLLQDPTSVKVGIGIKSDASKIFKDYNVSVRPLEDLSNLANSKLGGCRNWSLSALTEMLICKQLPKCKIVRLGNWEADILSKEQVLYAATDAFASCYLYQAINVLPEADNNKSAEPVPVAERAD